MEVKYCKYHRRCRSGFSPEDLECLECFAISTLIKHGRKDDASRALDSWLKRSCDRRHYYKHE
jgi:hypothetical protein